MEMLGIGEKLRNLRTCKKLSLKQVSERLGISVSSLSAYELNEKNSGLTDREINSIAETISLFRENKLQK